MKYCNEYYFLDARSSLKILSFKSNWTSVLPAFLIDQLASSFSFNCSVFVGEIVNSLSLPKTAVLFLELTRNQCH